MKSILSSFFEGLISRLLNFKIQSFLIHFGKKFFLKIVKKKFLKNISFELDFENFRLFMVALQKCKFDRNLYEKLRSFDFIAKFTVAKATY